MVTVSLLEMPCLALVFESMQESPGFPLRNVLVKKL